MHNSTPYLCQLPPGNPTTIPSHGPSLTVWLRRAQDIIANEGLREPEKNQLLLVVKAALEVCALYFAAVQEPTPAQIYNCFEDFFMHSLSSDRNEELEDSQ